MVTKEQIAKIIRDETWVEVDSAVVYGVNDAAEKIMQAIEAARPSVQSDVACTCDVLSVMGGVMLGYKKDCPVPSHATNANRWQA